MLGHRREKLLSENKLHVKAYDLNAKTYDAFLKAESREEKAFDADLKTKSEVEAQKTLDQLRKEADEGNLSQK